MQHTYLPIGIVRFASHPHADISQLVRCVVCLHEADESLDQAVRPAGTTQQVVDVV